MSKFTNLVDRGSEVNGQSFAERLQQGVKQANPATPTAGASSRGTAAKHYPFHTPR